MQDNKTVCAQCAHFLRAATNYYIYRCGDCMKKEKPCFATDIACPLFTKNDKPNNGSENL